MAALRNSDDSRSYLQKTNELTRPAPPMAVLRNIRSSVRIAESVTMGSRQSFDCFSKTAVLTRLAAVHDWKFKVLLLNDRLPQERTLTKNWSTSALRTKGTCKVAVSARYHVGPLPDRQLEEVFDNGVNCPSCCDRAKAVRSGGTADSFARTLHKGPRPGRMDHVWLSREGFGLCQRRFTLSARHPSRLPVLPR